MKLRLDTTEVMETPANQTLPEDTDLLLIPARTQLLLEELHIYTQDSQSWGVKPPFSNCWVQFGFSPFFNKSPF